MSSHLSRKLLLALVAAAVLSWGLMCGRRRTERKR